MFAQEGTGFNEWRNKPFDFTPGLFRHSLTPMPAAAPHRLPHSEAA
jgi:hypothetical protein